MNRIEDLNIENELLPLFDYSLNKFSQKVIFDLLHSPLKSISEILKRQQILKGFQENQKTLQDYSYTVLYFNEVYRFTQQTNFENLPTNILDYKIFQNKKQRVETKSKISLTIQFFHRLWKRYFVPINLNSFPDEYRKNILRITKFLSEFDLKIYEEIIRKKELRDKNVILLINRLILFQKNGEIDVFWNNFFLFEAYCSISHAITKNDFQYPEFSESEISINEFYHPLLPEPVKNSFETENNVIVLNGPNMSGKSTLLKSLSLCVYLGHLGFGIPATFGKFPFFNCFFIEINRKDNLEKGYSHFMTEILNLKNILIKAKAGVACFAVFDELFSGTNSEDAFEISKRTWTGLTKFTQSFFFISTHLEGLHSLSQNTISNFYLETVVKDRKPYFTYQLKEGWTDIKVGRILFENEGLNDLLKNK